MLRSQQTGGAGDRVPSTNRELLERSKLSHLPQRKPFQLTAFDNTPSATTVSAVCAGCGATLDITDPIQLRLCGCRKCISIYGRLEAANLESEKRARQAILEKFLGGDK